MLKKAQGKQLIANQFCSAISQGKNNSQLFETICVTRQECKFHNVCNSSSSYYRFWRQQNYLRNTFHIAITAQLHHIEKLSIAIGCKTRRTHSWTRWPNCTYSCKEDLLRFLLCWWNSCGKWCITNRTNHFTKLQGRSLHHFRLQRWRFSTSSSRWWWKSSISIYTRSIKEI